MSRGFLFYFLFAAFNVMGNIFCIPGKFGKNIQFYPSSGRVLEPAADLTIKKFRAIYLKNEATGARRYRFPDSLSGLKERF